MKLHVSGGGAGSFVVKDETTGEEMTVSSQDSGYQAVHAVAEWVNGAGERLAASMAEKAPKGKSIKPPKGDE